MSINEVQLKMSEINVKDNNTVDVAQAKDEPAVVPKSTDATETKRVKKPLSSMAEAKKDKDCAKLLINIDKPNTFNEPHMKLLSLVFKHVVQSQLNNKVDFFNQISLLKEYSSNVGMSVYYDNQFVKEIIDKYIPDADHFKNIIQYIRIVYGIVELVNMNILNTIVYVERKRISKNRLFNIIENTLFTQIIPTELNHVEHQFKTDLVNSIDELKTELLSKK